MKQIYMKYYNLFDSVVLYTGEDSFYDYKSLAVQYTQVVEKRKRLRRFLIPRSMWNCLTQAVNHMCL